MSKSILFCKITILFGFFYMIKPDCFDNQIIKKNYWKISDEYYSQKGQDKFLNENIFKNKRRGFFIEVGAHDGISFSNTYFFEKYLGWSGICIEPNPDIFTQLVQNRSAFCLQLGIASKNGILKYLKCSGFMLEMYSGIYDSMDERHKQRIEDEIKQFGGSKEIIEIECKRLQAIFDDYNIKHADMMSIDIEGGEEEAIKSIDFDKIKIDTIVIENNFEDFKIREYLFSKGYKLINRLGKDDIFQLEGVKNV